MSKPSDNTTCLAGLVVPVVRDPRAGEHKRQSANSAIEFGVCRLESPVLDQESEGKDL